MANLYAGFKFIDADYYKKVTIKKLQEKILANFHVFHVSAHFFKVFYQELFYTVHTASNAGEENSAEINFIKSFDQVVPFQTSISLLVCLVLDCVSCYNSTKRQRFSF